MASTTTKTRTPRTRKPKAVETPVETPEVPASTEIVKVAPKVDVEALNRLNALTDEAQAAIEAGEQANQAAGAAFWAASEALKEIRLKGLVEKSGITAEDGVTPLTYTQYVALHFHRSADYGLKYAKAGEVLERLRKELSEDEQKQFPLPLTESAARPLVTLLKTDPKGQKKHVSKAWKKAYEVATPKDGFIPTVIVPSQTDARKAADEVAKKARPVATGSNIRPADESTDKTLKALRKLHTETYSEIKWATFVALIAEGASFASKHTIGASAIRQYS